MPIKMVAVEVTKSTLLTSNIVSRDHPLWVVELAIWGLRIANSNSDAPTTITRNHKMKIPLSGSLAKEWTDVRIPERTKKAPSKLKEKLNIASRRVQLLKTPTEVVWRGMLKILHNISTRNMVRGTTALTMIADLGPKEM